MERFSLVTESRLIGAEDVVTTRYRLRTVEVPVTFGEPPVATSVLCYITADPTNTDPTLTCFYEPRPVDLGEYLLTFSGEQP